MNWRSYRTFQALILVLLGLFLLIGIWDGTIFHYINQRFVILVLSAALGMIGLAQNVLRNRPARSETSFAARDEGDTAGRNIWWVALPLAFGLLAPVRPLGSTPATSRGVNVYPPQPVIDNFEDQVILQIPPTERSFLDWLIIFNGEADPRDYVGEMADISGFVYRDPRLGANQFFVGSFSVVCCLADATAVGIIVQWEDAVDIKDDEWVRVQGVVDAVRMPDDSQFAGRSMPLLQAKSVEIIPEPSQPYLFP